MTAPRDQARAGVGLRLLRAAVFAAACVALAAAGHSLASCTRVPLASLAAGFTAVLVVAVLLAGRSRSLPGIAALLACGQLGLHTLFGLGQHAVAAGGAATGATASAGSAGSAGAAGRSVAEQAAQLLCGVPAAAIGPARARRVLTDAGIDPVAGPGMAGHHHGAGHGTGHAADQALAAGHAALLPSLPMLLAHLLAAVVAGWLLRHGERALFRLVALSARGAVEAALMRGLRAALALVRALRAGARELPAPARLRHRRPARAPKPQGARLQHSVIRRGPPAALALAA
ncbi:hypothetical protein [Streptomyces sp. SCSIO ZS0520]|uniref:hypothetical protein n=1 Tax=Streptomyces sp. SCSIO ZS0520 TaxID=2892996 RepID=UPI0021D83CD0|nr:hypothetical protein [Streptomyces sp. SCSIO ZS0520]